MPSGAFYSGSAASAASCSLPGLLMISSRLDHGLKNSHCWLRQRLNKNLKCLDSDGVDTGALVPMAGLVPPGQVWPPAAETLASLQAALPVLGPFKKSVAHRQKSTASEAPWMVFQAVIQSAA